MNLFRIHSIIRIKRNCRLFGELNYFSPFLTKDRVFLPLQWYKSRLNFRYISIGYVDLNAYVIMVIWKNCTFWYGILFFRPHAIYRYLSMPKDFFCAAKFQILTTSKSFTRRRFDIFSTNHFSLGLPCLDLPRHASPRLGHSSPTPPHHFCCSRAGEYLEPGVLLRGHEVLRWPPLPRHHRRPHHQGAHLLGPRRLSRRGLLGFLNAM